MIKYILKKEFLLIFRDIHALLVLFIMPAIFILIMSIALKNSYSQDPQIKQKVLVQTSGTIDTRYLIKLLNKSTYLEVKSDEKFDIKETIYSQNYDFVVKLNKDFKEQIKKNKKDFKIDIFSKPDISRQNYEIVKNIFIKNISKMVLMDYFKTNKINARILSTLDKKVNSKYIYKDKKFDIKPTSTQQSVPSWLVFSMFFILIPISNTFINEKNFGTINRIKSINVSIFPILFGKIIPYFIINQIQVFIMILVGIYVVPIFGGDKLVIHGNYFLIFSLTSVISLAAICFALLIANIAKTTETATSVGGVINIILAALGGIMVPKFVMPLFMQEVTNYSPMAWGLEGLVEIFVRGGNFYDILHCMLYLSCFAIICFMLSAIFLLKEGTK